MTALIEVIRGAAAKFEAAALSYGHGTDNAFDEAAWLALWKLGLPLDTDLGADVEKNRQVVGVQAQELATLFEARISTRKPAAYLTREAHLQGVSFYVDERAIVPRSFIAELLADGSIDSWLSDKTKRVLDLCTGNGSLAVLAAMAYPDVQIDAADLSAEALEVAKINVERHNLQGRITLLRGDGLGACADSVMGFGAYDLIVCNPPYVNTASMARLPAEYQAEPQMALAGGIDGMDFIRDLLADAPRFLSEHGVLVLEIGNERDHFERAFSDLPVHWLEVSAGVDQVLLVERDGLLAG
jgi:ribosomal protein L3 glutamine methyltransferase